MNRKHDLNMPDDVNAVVELLRQEVKRVLDHLFIGIYIHGSLAVGDFNPGSSDIDFLVVVKEALSQEIVSSLEAMHLGIATGGGKWAGRLEGSYVPIQAFRSKKPPVEPRPYLNEGRFYMAQYGYEWVLEKYTIREYGLVIDGPDPATFIAPVSRDGLQKACMHILVDWWEPMLEDSSRLQTPEYQTYGVMTMCRSLHMLTHGTMVSKKKAAAWAGDTLAKPWKALIKKALEWENGDSFPHLDETKAFIKFTLDYAKETV